MQPTTKYAGVILTLTAAQETNLDERGIPKNLGRLYRKINLAAYDKETHTVTMAVSSSTPVERYFGQEILSHDKGAIRVDRLKNGIALLFNHEYEKHLGRSQSYELGDPLHVTSRFGTNPLALEKEGDVDTGILVDVSIGYVVHEWEITEDKNGLRTYLAVDWELLEVSLVTVPADPTVGVGRSKDDAPVKVRSFRKLDDDETSDPEDEDEEDDDDDSDEDERSAAASQTSTTTTQPTAQRTKTMDETTVGPDLAAQERARVSALSNLRTFQPAHYTEAQLRTDINAGTAYAAASDALSERVIAAAQENTVRTAAGEVIGSMSDKEARQYSRAGAARAAINLLRKGTFDDTETGFAVEVSDQIRKAATERGISGLGNGILTPGVTNARFAAMEAQKRTVTSSGSSVGTATNFTEVIVPPIELLRSATMVMALGARMVPGLHGTPQFTRQNAAASSSWLAESASATASDPGLDFFTMTPNRLSMGSAYTRDFLALSNLAIDSFLAEDRNAVLARSLDYACLAGSGTGNVPKGLLNRTGLSLILPGTTRAANGTVTAGTGGVPPTYVDLNAFESTISTANGNIGTMGWLSTPKLRAVMRSILKFPGVNGGDPLMPDSKVGANGIQEGPLGYNSLFSSAVPTNGTNATGQTTGLHLLMLGVWDQMLIGDWDLSEIIADNITGAASATYKIWEHGYYDTNVRHLECFVAGYVQAQ